MASVSSILEELGYKTTVINADKVLNEFDDCGNSGGQGHAAESLQRWLALLPKEVTSQIALAKDHALPFMPPGVTPEMLSSRNTAVPMDQIGVVCRCLDIAFRSKDYDTAAALIFVVDRALYRFGRSKPLLRVVSEIQRVSPDTAIAPQVILRQARVMKDDGDLNGAMRIIQAIINKERKWPYKSEQQYQDTKAACLHVVGQIYHNLELWREAVHPLVEAIRMFRHVGDKKGISSCLTVLSRCVPRLDHDDYLDIRRKYPDVFQSPHPCYEGYQQGLEAVSYVGHIEARFFAAKCQLVADESLLMYTVQQNCKEEQHALLHTILDEVKKSLAGHRAVQFLHSVEAYIEFVRGVFMVSQVLSFSCVCGDKDLARFFEKLTMELYQFMVCRPGEDGSGEPPASLRQTAHSVSLMNKALKVLGLPALEGEEEILDQREEESQGHASKNSPRVDAAVPSMVKTAIKGIDTEIESQEATPHPVIHSVENESSCPTRDDTSNLFSTDRIPKGSANLSRTFPSAASEGHSRQRAGRQHERKFVGLPLTIEELRASTCPALSPEAVESLSLEGDHLEPDEDEVEALSVSARTLSSTSCSEAYSDVTSGNDVTSDDQVLTELLAAVKRPVEISQTPNTEQPRAFEENPRKEPLEPLSSSPEVDGQAGSPEETALLISSGNVKTDDTEAMSERLSERGSDVSTVDLNKTTKSSSRGVSSSCSSASADPAPKAKSSSPNSAESSALSPLVDLSSSSSKSLIEEANLGECNVKTDDVGEYLANWVPSSDTGVQRAQLYTFNPETKGQPWFCQTTLAHLGSKLQTDREGTFRDAYHISLLHQDEPLGRYVGKRYRQQRKPADYMRDVECQMIAGYYVTRFNQQLSDAPEEFLRAQYLPAFFLKLLDENGDVLNWVNVEPYLHGSFLKLTNNDRYVTTRSDLENGVEVATAFTHFSYVETQGELMVVDLQGWVPSSGGGVIYLTDPVLHTKKLSKLRICRGDRHEEGMLQFWQHVHPVCNRICCYLGLDKKRPDGTTS